MLATHPLCLCTLICKYIIFYQAGAQNISTTTDNNSPLNGPIDSDGAIYIVSGCFTVIFTLINLIFMRVARRTYHLLNASYFLTLISFCFQTAVAVVSACYTTIHEQQLSSAIFPLRIWIVNSFQPSNIS